MILRSLRLPALALSSFALAPAAAGAAPQVLEGFTTAISAEVGTCTSPDLAGLSRIAEAEAFHAGGVVSIDVTVEGFSSPPTVEVWNRGSVACSADLIDVFTQSTSDPNQFFVTFAASELTSGVVGLVNRQADVVVRTSGAPGEPGGIVLRGSIRIPADAKPGAAFTVAPDFDVRFELVPEADLLVYEAAGTFPVPDSGAAAPILRVHPGDPNQTPPLFDLNLLGRTPYRWGGVVNVNDQQAIGYSAQEWFLRVQDANGWVIADLPIEHGILNADRDWISAAFGGRCRLRLEAGPQSAGSFYLLLGSASGVAPPVLLPGPFGFQGSALGLPLATSDPYFGSMLSAPGATLFDVSFGPLGNQGEAVARFTLPPGALQLSQTLVLHHAAVILDPFTFQVTAFSNAERLEIRPGF